MPKNDNDLFYCCSVIELIGRICKLKRVDVVNALGKDIVGRIYEYADVFHCEPIAKTADDFINLCHIEQGSYDNVAECNYDVPDYWDIGEVYARLIEDVSGDDVIPTLLEIYASFLSDSISNYNSDFYYQSRDYIHECYKAGTILL